MYLLILSIILSPWSEYRAARQLYDDGEFTEAKTEFESLLQKYPHHDIVSYCMFYIANLSRDPEEAVGYYENIIDSYPASTVVDNAHARLASYYYITGEYSKADSIYLKIISDYPDGDCVQEARKWRDRIENFAATSFFAVQVGAFKNLKNAEGLISDYPDVATDIVFDGTFYKALIGRFTSREDAVRFKKVHKIDGFIVKIPEEGE
ncbi:MAG: tetratricopeptide repeat protein [candidate division WOR-3 bacterium]|nr:tetratricopeptide repeat protein [candidate division WOR-3 bacterium]